MTYTQPQRQSSLLQALPAGPRTRRAVRLGRSAPTDELLDLPFHDLAHRLLKASAYRIQRERTQALQHFIQAIPVLRWAIRNPIAADYVREEQPHIGVRNGAGVAIDLLRHGDGMRKGNAHRRQLPARGDEGGMSALPSVG